MAALARHPGIALPRKQIDCGDDELLREHSLHAHTRQYRRLSGALITSADELIDLFYDYNRGAPFAGFKSMPHRHKRYGDSVARPDIQAIILRRRDLASTLASFMLATEQGIWRRAGERASARWRFGDHNRQAALSILRNLKTNLHKLEAVADRIDLVFEDLCDRAFQDPRLDACFGRRITIDDSRLPVSGETCTDSWDAFLTFVREAA